jgi:hypothetical protein
MVISKIQLIALVCAALVALAALGCETASDFDTPTTSTTLTVDSIVPPSRPTVSSSASAPSGAEASSTTVDSQPIPSVGSITNELCTIRSIEFPFDTYGTPRSVGSVILVPANPEGAHSKILAYDFDSGETSVVANSEHWICWVTANERWLLWETEEIPAGDPLAARKGKLYAREIETGETQVLSYSRNMYAAALDGDKVAWQDLTPGNKLEVVVHDLDTRTRQVVAPVTLPGFYNNFMFFKDGRLVWTDVVDGAGVYRLYDVSSGDIEDHRLADTQYYIPGYVKAAGDRLFSLNFDNCEEWNWNKQQFGYFDLKTENFVEIPMEGDVGVNYFAASEEWLAVVDRDGRLGLRPVATAVRATPVYPLGDAPVDGLQASDDGTFVVGRISPTSYTVTLLEMR